MKITSNNVDSFIGRLEAKICGVLLYGPDYGLISERAGITSKKIVADINDPFLVKDLSPEQIKEDEAILADEVSAISFIPGRRLIRIKSASNTMADTLSAVIKHYYAGTNYIDLPFLLVTAGELDTSSKLRKLFENTEILAALPCYKDEGIGLDRVIESELNRHLLKYSGEIISYLAASLPSDRMMIRNEIEKLALYAGEQKNLSLETVEKVIKNLSESSFSEIINASLDSRQAELAEKLERAFLEGMTPIAIIRILIRYIMQLHIVITSMEKGMNIETAINNLRPPVFFKQLPHLKRHVGIWKNLGSLGVSAAVAMLHNAEGLMKKTGSEPELICSRALLEIGLMPQRKIAA